LEKERTGKGDIIFPVSDSDQKEKSERCSLIHEELVIEKNGKKGEQGCGGFNRKKEKLTRDNQLLLAERKKKEGRPRVLLFF